MHGSSKVKKNKITILCCAHTKSEYFNNIFFFSIFSLLFSISARCSSLLSPHTSFLPITADQVPTQRWPKPQPAPTTLCILHNSTPSLFAISCPAPTWVSISHFLSLDLHLKGRTSELHPLSTISCPAPMWVYVCVFRSVVGSGLSLSLWQWACVFRSVGILAPLMKFSVVFCLQCFPMWLLWGRRWIQSERERKTKLK